MPNDIDRDRRMNAILWTLQIILTLLFLFTGGVKLAMPMAALAKVTPLPATFMKFIAVCELLGALGLVLPGLTGIATYLTPLAAAGLTIIVIGATVVTVATLGIPQAVLPFVTTLLVAFVAYGRWRRVPLRSKSDAPNLRRQTV